MEGKKYELADLQSQLSGTEERLNHLQQEYARVDSERDSLRDALKRFQSNISRIMKLNRLRGMSDEVKQDDLVQLLYLFVCFKDRKGEFTGDLTDDVIFKSTPFPPAPDFKGEASVDMDLSNLDITLQSLMSRIEQLQRERVCLRGCNTKLNVLRTSTARSLIVSNDRRANPPLS